MAAHASTTTTEQANGWSQGGRRPVLLLEQDPELGFGLEPDEFRAAARAVVAPSESILQGTWRPNTERPTPGGFGVLLMSGLMVRELKLGACAGFAELLGPGDLLRPWQTESEAGLLPWSTRWKALEPCEIADVDHRVARVAARWPEVTSNLMSRALQRARRQGVAASIPTLVRAQDRLVVLFLHLAERWGHVTPDGILVRLPLTHSLLARLTGARRPTVTTSLGALAERDLIQRPDTDGWLLRPAIHQELEQICSGQMVRLDLRGPADNG